jgi:hypothetical protein
MGCYQIRTLVPVTRTVAAKKMPRYNNAEYGDMNFLCGFLDVNALAAFREYQHQYPDRRQPYRRVLERVHCNLRETGAVMIHSHAGRGMSNVWDQDDVLYTVHANPSAGIHHIYCESQYYNL